MAFNRGDIVLVNFNPTKGKEIGKYRPAVIMSSQMDNTFLPTLMVIPLSTQLVENAMPYRFRLTAREQLAQDSDACINEIRALAKERVQSKLASVTQNEYQMLMKGLCQILETE
mgnify:CR=1 FL=1